MTHPWTLDAFRTIRPDQYNYTANVIYGEGNDGKFKVVHAPVKSGKRSFPEIASLLNPSCEHVFITALNRTSDKEQHVELAKYGIHVHIVFNKKSAAKCISSVMGLLQQEAGNKKEIHVHLDELDYGCKHDQIMSGVYLTLKEEEDIKFILYSATADVVKRNFLDTNVSGFVDIDPFVPSKEVYYGIDRFIDDGRLVQSLRFLEAEQGTIRLSGQAKECVSKLLRDTYNKDNKQHIGVVRLPGRQEGVHDFHMLKNHVHIIHEYVSACINETGGTELDINVQKKRLENGIKVVFAGSKDEIVRWDDADYWQSKYPADIPVLIVICQVAGRSTEWKCHPYLSWFHTCRSDSTTVSTLIQDQERVVYYNTEYNKDNDITLYGNLSCALYSAGRISFEQLIVMTKKKLSLTLAGKLSLSANMEVKSTVYDHWEDIPAIYTLGKTKDNFIADKFVLREQMSYTKVKNGKTMHYLVDVPKWEDDCEYKGMYMTDVRGSVCNFLEWCYYDGKKKTTKLRKPVWTQSDMKRYASAGVNKTHPVRINVFYEDGEKDPENYKFMVRELGEGGVVEAFKNHSMYNLC